MATTAPPRRFAAASPSPPSSSEPMLDDKAASDGDASQDEGVAAFIAARSVAVHLAWRLQRGGVYRSRAYAGSVPGRRANRNRDFECGMRRIMAD